MELRTTTFIFVLLYTAYCKPTDPSDDVYSYDDVQNDNNDNNDYPVDYPEGEEKDDDNDENNTPLAIKSLGQEFIANLSGTVTLPCVITGRNYVQIWSKKKIGEQNSEKKDAILFQAGINMAASPNMKLLEDGSLQISNLHPQDEGVYDCVAMDTLDSSPKIQHTVLLTMQPTIDLLEAKENRKTLKTGDTLELTCKAHGVPKPTISWHKGSNRFDVEGEVFKITNVKHHDAGVYKCLADNKIGEPAFSHINIKVEFKPVITIDRISVSSENNSETELRCLVHAEPKAQVVWIKDGVNVVSTERIQLISNDNKHNLVLKNLQSSDFGVYTCSATNYLGNTKRNIKLVKTPSIVRLTKSRTDTNEVVLTWEVQSKSNLTQHEFLYRKKGDTEWKTINPEVSPLGDDHYAVKYVFDKNLDPGDYETRMRSQNMNGWSEYSDVIPFQRVHSKHGHHKDHKKGHKHGKGTLFYYIRNKKPSSGFIKKHDKNCNKTLNVMNAVRKVDVSRRQLEEAENFKEKQVTTTPTPPLEPAEHQENDIQAGSSSTVTESSASSLTPTVLLTNIALITFLQSLRI